MGQTALHIPGHTLQEIAGVRDSILRTLSYFDIFYYPLDPSEILRFLDRHTDQGVFDQAIGELTDEKKIYYSQGFYSIQNNPLLAIRRLKGNQRAEDLLRKARKIGRWLYQFPFVRAIGVSGSLSKDYADEQADIDFFIITHPNRLWVARTLMHLYKKLTFISRRQHFHCMNYYVDENALELKEHNIYTAIEIKTLLPVSGAPAMRSFFEANNWTEEWFPACSFREQCTNDPANSWLKRWMEWMLNGKLGNRIDNYLLRLTRRRWDRKQKNGRRNDKGQAMGLICDKHFARSNPGGFQERVLTTYHHKINRIH